MNNNISRCPHVATIGIISKEDYLNATKVWIFYFNFVFKFKKNYVFSLKNVKNVIVLDHIYGYV